MLAQNSESAEISTLGLFTIAHMGDESDVLTFPKEHLVMNIWDWCRVSIDVYGSIRVSPLGDCDYKVCVKVRVWSLFFCHMTLEWD